MSSSSLSHQSSLLFLLLPFFFLLQLANPFLPFLLTHCQKTKKPKEPSFSFPSLPFNCPTPFSFFSSVFIAMMVGWRELKLACVEGPAWVWCGLLERSLHGEEKKGRLPMLVGVSVVTWRVAHVHGAGDGWACRACVHGRFFMGTWPPAGVHEWWCFLELCPLVGWKVEATVVGGSVKRGLQ